jgi:hypothetical protein
MTRVVGLCGVAGSGKSVAADELERMGFKRVRFSAALKDMLRAFYRSCGLDESEIERRIEGDLKEVADPLLGGKTPRYAMQTLGKEWGRDLIWDELWSRAWRSRAEKELEAGHRIVAEDVRFATEDAEIHRLDGKIVEIVGRHKPEVAPTHASELFTGVHPDMQARNDTTIAALRGWMNYVFRSVDDQESAACA